MLARHHNRSGAWDRSDRDAVGPSSRVPRESHEDLPVTSAEDSAQHRRAEEGSDATPVADATSVADAAAAAEQALAQAADEAEKAVRDAHTDGHQTVEQTFADAQRDTDIAYEQAASRSDRDRG